MKLSIDILVYLYYYITNRFLIKKMKKFYHDNIYDYNVFEYFYLNKRYLFGSLLLLILAIFAIITVLMDSHAVEVIIEGAIDD